MYNVTAPEQTGSENTSIFLFQPIMFLPRLIMFTPQTFVKPHKISVTSDNLASGICTNKNRCDGKSYAYYSGQATPPYDDEDVKLLT